MNLLDTLDPYEHLTWAIGTGDDFVCLDYTVSEDRTQVAFASVVNSETGSFIDNFGAQPTVVPAGEAVAYAQSLVCNALDWASDMPRLDMKGWNQDPTWFVRCVRASLGDGPYETPPRRVRNWRKDLA
jgi:hypothetical protein